jgi:hypothetical protein
MNGANTKSVEINVSYKILTMGSVPVADNV